MCTKDDPGLVCWMDRGGRDYFYWEISLPELRELQRLWNRAWGGWGAIADERKVTALLGRIVVKGVADNGERGVVKEPLINRLTKGWQPRHRTER